MNIIHLKIYYINDMSIIEKLLFELECLKSNYVINWREMSSIFAD